MWIEERTSGYGEQCTVDSNPEVSENVLQLSMTSVLGKALGW